MIFGAVVDPDMGDDIRITVIATGFERSAMPRRISTAATTRSAGNTLDEHFDGVNNVSVSANAHTNAEFRPQTFNTDDLDIPTFLRNRK
jgi:cell division protein FtsZ